MKSVHKALHLRHHKHTGKLLPHKHTSYRVLFSLMLAPIIMLALVGQLATAAEYQVTAMVPAPMPEGAPVITSPENSSTTDSDQILVSGTCPVIDPPIIVTIYDNGVFVGSAQCTNEGSFAVPVALSMGSHSILATILTMTGQTGASSTPVTITRVAPNPPTAGSSATAAPLRIHTTDAYLEIGQDGQVEWHGRVVGGTAPYTVRVEWGDGAVNTYTVTDESDQTFTHIYKDKQTYIITISAVDAAGNQTSIQTIAGSLALFSGLATLEYKLPGSDVMPVFGFIHRYLWQIYIIVLSALGFLWYLERGRHLPRVVFNKLRKKPVRLRHHHR